MSHISAIIRLGDIKVGVGICYDIRFSELARLYANQGMNNKPQVPTTIPFMHYGGIKSNARLVGQQTIVTVYSRSVDMDFVGIS